MSEMCFIADGVIESIVCGCHKVSEEILLISEERTLVSCVVVVILARVRVRAQTTQKLGRWKCFLQESFTAGATVARGARF